jgi:diacylglycerol O-acyltransferase
MQQLSGLDALFLHMEQANIYMHIGPVMVYAPGAGSRDLFQAIYQSFERGLQYSNIFRRKLKSVPLDIDRPYWLEDSDFCLDNHLSHTYLPAPGDWAQLCAEISRLHATPLDRNLPLWAAHVIEGLDALEGMPRGCFAIYLKTHHATQDGATGVKIVQAIHDSASGIERQRETDNWQAEADPYTAQLMGRAMINNIRRPFAMARVAAQALPAARQLLGAAEDDAIPLLLSERTRFSAPVSEQRVVGFARFEFAELQAIRAAVANATLNDVCSCIVAGSLRRYLLSKGELPASSLIAGAPVNARREGQVGAGGNVISAIRFALHSQCEDPLQRLQAIRRETAAAKQSHQDMGSELLVDLAESLPGYLSAWSSKALLKSNLLARMQPVLHTLISNVPGPREPLYLAGAQMQMILGLGPCVDGIGLFHTISSYCQTICIGFQSCPRMLPDPEFYSQCLRESFEELAAAAR